MDTSQELFLSVLDRGSCTRENTIADGARERKLLHYSVFITEPNYSQITMQNASALNDILVIDTQSEPNSSS